MPSLTSVNARVTPVSATPTTARSVTVPGLVTDVVTVTPAVLLLPSLFAVTVAEPVATPATRPVADTVATPLLVVVQVTVRPVRTFPAESLVTAASWTVWPAVTHAAAGLTVTDATGTALIETSAVSASVPRL